MVDPELEVGRERVPVAEYVFHDAPVGRRSHCMEVVPVFDLVYVHPCRQVDVGSFPEPELLSVDDHVHVSIDHDDDQMVLRLPWLAPYDMIFAFDFSCEDVIVYVADFFHALFAE